MDIKECVKSGHDKKEQASSEEELTGISKNENTAIQMKNSVRRLSKGLELERLKRTRRQI